MSQIQDPLTHNTVRVDGSNRLQTFTIAESVTAFSGKNGDAFNINTGITAYTGTSDSSLMYLKNNSETDLVITQIIIGIGLVTATITDDVLVSLIRNPTGGNIITDATAVQANANLNFGSSKVLDVDVFKGKDGGTITGGTNGGVFYVSSQERTPAPLNIRIPTGASLGLTLDLGTSGGGNVYAALVCHLHDNTQL